MGRQLTRAAKVCPQPGCPLDQPCPEHTPKPWANANQRRPDALRGEALQKRNARVLKRHGTICHLCGMAGATKVDHVTPYAEGGTDADHNLRPVHPSCHDAKTAQEAHRGRTR